MDDVQRGWGHSRSERWASRRQAWGRAKAPWSVLATAGAGLLLVGCSSSAVTANAGVSEPIIVHATQATSGVPSVQFFPGSLRGLLPAGPDAGPPQTPAVKAFNAANNPTVLAGAAGKSFTGAATNNGSSVGIRFADMGTGYWVVPLGIASGEIQGALSFAFSADFATTIPPGKHPLRAVAIDNNGHAGRPSTSPSASNPASPTTTTPASRQSPPPRPS